MGLENAFHIVVGDVLISSSISNCSTVIGNNDVVDTDQRACECIPLKQFANIHWRIVM